MNKATLSTNVAKVEAKEKELAEAKAKAKVMSFHSNAPSIPLYAQFKCREGGRGGFMVAVKRGCYSFHKPEAVATDYSRMFYWQRKRHVALCFVTAGSCEASKCAGAWY